MAHKFALIARAGLAAAFAVAAGSPAYAQCRLCTNPTTKAESLEEEGKIALSIETALDFDRLVISGAGEGSATILPNGERSASGTITAISGRAMVGEVRISGEAARALRIELPRRVELYTLSGGSIVIDDVVSDVGEDPRLDANGQLAFRFGGRLIVSGESEGEYRGDLPITVEYQ